MLRLSEPIIIQHAPYQVVGAYCAYQGDDEGPGWDGASREFARRRGEITNATDGLTLGFLYRPHTDHPGISEDVQACFIGVDVADLDHVPAGMATTRFSGGDYVIVACQGDTEDEAAACVGEAIAWLGKWIPEHGYVEGDACFACSDEKAPRPPFIERVYIKLEPAGTRQ